MIAPHTKRIFLSPVTDADTPLLFAWRNTEAMRALCSCRRNTVTADEFASELAHDFSYDRHEQYLVVRCGDECPVGTIYSYNVNLEDGYAFITTFIDQQYRGKGYGVHAFLLFATHLFERFRLFKIYTETYAYNEYSLRTSRNAGLIEEGRFKGHRIHDGIRHDLYRLALYRDDALEHMRKLALRLGSCEC